MYHDDGPRCPPSPGTLTQKRPPPIHPRGHPQARGGSRRCAQGPGLRPDRSAGCGMAALTGHSLQD